MIDQVSPSGHVRVHYHVLEADNQGRSPEQKDFDRHSKSPLQVIAKGGNKVKYVLIILFTTILIKKFIATYINLVSMLAYSHEGIIVVRGNGQNADMVELIRLQDMKTK